jgi:hypothetical protein
MCGRRAVAAPVLTWASRTAAHRATSCSVAAFQRRWWRRKPIVRIALRPLDFDHPSIVNDIARSLDTLRNGRSIVTHEEAHAAQ